ncbi:helix-hairpin-helix domain-containing protein [Gemmatimonas sp.]
MIDCFISAVRFMEGSAPHRWWHYTPERKTYRLRMRCCAT